MDGGSTSVISETPCACMSLLLFIAHTFLKTFSTVNFQTSYENQNHKSQSLSSNHNLSVSCGLWDPESMLTHLKQFFYPSYPYFRIQGQGQGFHCSVSIIINDKWHHEWALSFIINENIPIKTRSTWAWLSLCTQ